jgi:aryl-alcohol dehydrogenase-like predicted oxidoreductase
MIDKFIFGTAQWGFKYGIASCGVPNLKEIEEIIKLGYLNDILYLDTAYAYGNSEQNIISSNGLREKNRIITKIPPIDGCINASKILDLKNNFLASPIHQFVGGVYGLLIHRGLDLKKKNAKLLWEFVTDLKDRGLVNKIGASFYNLNDLIDVTNEFDLDIVQVPVNIVDQRFLHENILQEIHARGIEVHARSVFLQGMLLNLQKYSQIPNFLQLQTLFDYIRRNDLDPYDFCLSYVLSIPYVSKVIVGVENIEQTRKLINFKFKNTTNISHKNFEIFRIDNLNITNPSNWKFN